MSERIPSDHPLTRLFGSAVDRAFRNHPGVYSPDVADHIGENVLAGFVHADRLYRLRNTKGKRLEDLPEMLEIAHQGEGPERRLEVDCYIGDFVLFVGGFFPNALRKNTWFAARPMVAKVGAVLVNFSQPLDYYLAEGRNAYSRAAATARLFDPESHHTFQRLGKHIETYLAVVTLVKTLLQDEPPVRQIEGLIG